MRRPLGAIPSSFLAALLVPLLLVGCGDDGDDGSSTASDPTTSTPTSESVPPTSPPGTGGDTDEPTKSPPLTPGGVPFELREMVSVTVGRGVASPEAVALTTPAEVDAFTAPFSGQLADEVRAAVAAEPAGAGETLYGAVVADGCDVPPGVDVTESAEGYAIVGLKVADPLPECFAPVTSVAIVAISG